MLAISILFVSLLLLIESSFALTGTWTSPPPAGIAGDFSSNEVHSDGAQMKISFTTNATIFNVVLWQNNCRAPFIIKENTTDTDFLWTVDIKSLPLPAVPLGYNVFGNVAYLGILETEPDQPFVTSHYFNLSDPSITTTASLAMTSVSSSIDPTRAAITATTQTDINTAATALSVEATSSTLPGATSAAATGLSPGAAAGVAVGVILGVLGVVVAAGALFLLRRRKGPTPPPKAAVYREATSNSSVDISPYISRYKPRVPSFQQRPLELSPEYLRHEVEASTPQHELPSYPSTAK